MCPEGPAFTIAAVGDAIGTRTANFTHHFLIAMPAMADPHFSHTLTYAILLSMIVSLTVTPMMTPGLTASWKPSIRAAG